MQNRVGVVSKLGIMKQRYAKLYPVSCRRILRSQCIHWNTFDSLIAIAV